ncbi:DBF4-type zinc finger-containing protein 2 homolog [Oryx dammah]|uniref:DBF4-type zinc finger-containing protein 2 homolog n=1 Tax=Oryx dammah TaxID=59534 RepID=UPI001A9ABBB7|nr:DBF4-type zinc finger-containing protein 2 homolog [Oryx dammah]
MESACHQGDLRLLQPLVSFSPRSKEICSWDHSQSGHPFFSLDAQVEAPGLSGNDICPPGFFCPRGTGFPVPCSPGFYSSAPGLASEQQCQPCPPGHYCSRPGLSHVLDAGVCDAGYICLGGSVVPSPSDGAHGYRCPPGFRCPAGAHSELPCEPGTFSPLPGADTCLPCPGGTYCQKAATVEPVTCPKGHYCPAGTPSPHPCPEGTLNPREAALSSRACQPCPAGTYCPGEGNGQPEGPCSAGYYCEGGASSSTPWRNSAFPLNGPCPRGHYCPQGTLHPVPCPMGRTRSSPGEPLTRASHPPAMGPSLFNSHSAPQGHSHSTPGASLGLAPWGSLGGHESRQHTKDRLAQCTSLGMAGGDPGTPKAQS